MTSFIRCANFSPRIPLGASRAGTLYGGIELKLLRGLSPWDVCENHADHAALKEAGACAKIDYPKPDGAISFDRLSSVFISNTNHEEDQPAHLTLGDVSVPIADQSRALWTRPSSAIVRPGSTRS